MTFDDYQGKAVATAIYPRSHAVVYPTLGLVGESGEVAEKVKKVLRDHSGYFSDEKRAEIAKELGDALWYVANVAADLNYTLSEIAALNVAKLASRAERGVLQGSGDER